MSPTRRPASFAYVSCTATLDVAVRDAYGWSDLALDHGFHDTSQGVRFTIGPAARTEILDRLLELNHARHAEELQHGIFGRRKRATRAKPSESQGLFGD